MRAVIQRLSVISVRGFGVDKSEIWLARLWTNLAPSRSLGNEVREVRVQWPGLMGYGRQRQKDGKHIEEASEEESSAPTHSNALEIQDTSAYVAFLSQPR